MNMDALSLLSDIVAINTSNPPGNETILADYLYTYLKQYTDNVEYIGEGSRKNVIALFGDISSKNVLGFNGHLDTVPAGDSWEYDPFKISVVGNKCFGRGTADMKGGIVASILAIVKAKNMGYLSNKLVIFMGTVDEETGADSELGCKMVIDYLFQKGIRLSSALIPEPSSRSDMLQINIGHRGLLWLRCTAKGVAGHSGLLGAEDNAIIKINSFINQVYKLFPQKPAKINGIPQSSCRVVYISSAESYIFNKIPDRCECNLDIRVSPVDKNESVLENITSIANKNDVNVTLVKNTPSATISKDEKIVKVIEDTISNMDCKYIISHASPTCDAHWFISRGIPAVNGLGPGGGNVHAPNEYVLFNTIKHRIDLFANIIKNF